MVPDISFGFSFFIYFLDISSILSFELLHLFLISSASSTFLFASFVSNIFFAISIGVEKSKCFLHKSLFMPFDSLSIKAMLLLMNLCISSFVFSFISSFVLNTLLLNGKILFSKRPIISSLTRNNSPADFKTLFFSSFFINSCFLVSQSDY